MADDSTVEMLKAIVGDGVGDETLRALLISAGGDVSAAANSFFDGGVASLMNEAANDMPAPPAGVGVGEDVLGTLFKTLEDQGRKLAERDQQLDMASKVCEALVRHGAVVNATDEIGKTALMMAAAGGHHLVVRTLVALGARMEAADAEGHTALLWAARGTKAKRTVDGTGGTTALMLASAAGHSSGSRPGTRPAAGACEGRGPTPPAGSPSGSSAAACAAPSLPAASRRAFTRFLARPLPPGRPIGG